MNPDNFDETLEALMSRQPFKPFTIEVNTGKRFEIDHPRAVTFRHGFAIFISPGGTPIFFDHEGVTQIIYSPAHAAPGKDAVNGE